MCRMLASFALVVAASSALAVNVHIYNLGDSAISSAATNQVITSGVSAQGIAQAFIDRLDGANAITLQANFSWGSGGTSLKVDVETSLDQGLNWLPVCRFAFTTATALKVATISGLTPRITAAAPATLADDTCFDGTIGDRVRAKITSTGTYAGSVVSVRAAVR